MTDKPKDHQDNNGTPTSESRELTATASSAAAKSDTGAKRRSGNGRPGRRGSGPLSWLALILALAAVAGSGYVWQLDARQRQQLADNRVELAAAAQRIDSQAEQLRQLQRQLDQQTDSAADLAQTLNDKMADLQRRLNTQQQRLQTLSTTDRADWLLAEAEYLMRLAHQRLMMGEEIAGARQLLQAADEILVELDDAGLYPVRRALAEDMAELRAAGDFDLEGLYLRLEAAAEQGERLQLFDMPQLETAAAEPEPPQDWQQRLQSGLAAAWDKLSRYIRIERRDQPYKPLLAPEYEAAVRQNLRLMFEQAQMAALSGKQRLYEDSLEQARYWLDNYYTLDQTAAQALIDTIESLKQRRVEMELPDISGSLRALKTYLETRHDVAPAPPREETSGSDDTAEATPDNGEAAPAETGQ